MRDVLYWAHVALVMAGAFALGAIGVVAVKAIKIEDALTAKTGLLARAAAIEQKTFATLDNLDKYTKTWAGAANEQAAAIQTTTSKVNTFIDHATTVVDNANPALSQLKADLIDMDGTIRQATALEGQATTTIAGVQVPINSATQTFTNLNDLLKSTALTEILANTQDTTKNVAGITGGLKAEEDKLFNPPPCTGRWCFFKKAWLPFKLTYQLGEPTYFWWQLVK